MRKRTIHNWVSKIAWTFVLLFPLFHFFFFGLASANQNPTAISQNVSDESRNVKSLGSGFDNFMLHHYTWLSPVNMSNFWFDSSVFVSDSPRSFGFNDFYIAVFLSGTSVSFVYDNLANNPVGLFIKGVLFDNSGNLNPSFDPTVFVPDSWGVFCMINWIVYVVCIRLLLAVFLFIPKFATKLLNRFSADDEVIL